MVHLSVLRRGLPALIGCAGLLAIWYGWHRFAESQLTAESESTEASVEVRTQVELSPEKIASAKIVCQTVEARSGRSSVTVPGRLAYDESQRVHLRLATSGLVTQVLVKPGDRVTEGQVLAKMNSPEVGTARADEMRYAADLELARRQSAWDTARSAGIHKLVKAIRANQPPAQIREQFTDELLGAVRENLLTAYSSQLRAQSLVSRIENAVGALPARTVDERQYNVEVSRTALQAVIEQTTFEAERSAQSSKIALDDARRRWQIAAGRVATLLGQTPPSELDEARSFSLGQRPSGGPSTTAEDLSVIEVRATKSGTVEQRLFNENERVEAGEVLFVLADTSQLWLRADLRESQWSSLALNPGQEIEATSPALPDEVLKATVVMMGREVDPRTNTISLVGSVPNSYGRLKPGLFVRVQLPTGNTTTQVIIPEAAVATHAGQTFVFVTTDDRTFMRRDIRVGTTQAGWSEVIAGVAAGERIATEGVFVLKSELLLESEE